MTEPDIAAPAVDYTTRPRRRGRKRFIFFIILVLAAIAASPFLINFIYNVIHYVSTDDAFIEGDVTPISPRVPGTVARVLINDNQDIQAGQMLVLIDPNDYEASLAQSRAALAAARAQRDQALVNLDLTSVTSTAGVSQASFGVEAGHSGISTAQAQAAVAESQVHQAESNLSAAEAALEEEEAKIVQQQAVAERAEANWKRYETLFKDNVVSAEQRDFFRTTAAEQKASLEAERKKAAVNQAQMTQARAALQTALHAQGAAQAQIATARASTGQATGRLREASVTPQRMATALALLQGAEAEIKRLDAATTQAALNLSYTRITAPVAGHITRKAVEPGIYVQVGQPLFSIVPHNVWVVANFKETQLTGMKPGQPAEIEVDTFPGVTFKGHVDSIQRGTGARFSLFPPENATGNYIKVVQRIPVKIVLDEQPEGYILAPGMSVVPNVRVK